MDERVLAFIDGSNMFHCGRDRGMRVNYMKLRELLSSDRFYGHNVRLIRPYFYGSTTGDEKQEGFHERLRMMGYEVRTVELREKDGMPYEKGVDVWLAVDMVSFAAKGHCDCVVLASGDGDFIPAVKSVKECGIPLYLAAFDHCCSTQLKIEADHYIDLNQYLNELRY